MSISQVFNFIHEEYGLRGGFISEISKKLGISYRHANILTIKAGYKRTKKVSAITFAQFSNDLSVQYIVSKI